MAEHNKTIEYVSVENLLFDPENPRLPSHLRRKLKKKYDERAVLEWMLKDATIIDLMAAIGEKGYFPGEPLLVAKQDGKKGAGYFIVVEGNRRLCAVKLLNDPSQSPSRKIAVINASNAAKKTPEELPVIAYNNREEILDYLGYRHITGIKEWDTLAKARYLKDLYKKEKGTPNEKFKVLARSIGSTPSYCSKLLTTLELYEEIEKNNFFGIKDLNEETIDFSVLLTALGYKNILEFLNLAGNDPVLKGLKKGNLKFLTSLIFEKDEKGRTRLGESRELRRLSAIVASDRAMAALKKGISLKEAELLTGTPAVVFRTALSNAKIQLVAARDHVDLVDNFTPSDSDTLNEIQNIAGKLKISVDQNINKETKT